MEIPIPRSGNSYIKLMQENGHTMNIGLTTRYEATQEAVVRAAHTQRLHAVAHCMSASETMQLLEFGVVGMIRVVYEAPLHVSFVAA